MGISVHNKLRSDQFLSAPDSRSTDPINIQYASVAVERCEALASSEVLHDLYQRRLARSREAMIALDVRRC